MKAQKLVLAIAVAAMGLGARAWAEDTVDSVKKDLAAKWDAVKSFTGKVEMQMIMTRGDSKMTSQGTGVVECLKKGGAELIRTEMSIATTIPGSNGAEGKTVQNKQLRVFDGTTTFTEMDMNGVKRAMKTTRAQSAMTGGGKALTDQLEKVYTLSLLSEEKVGDRDVYVVSGAPKPGSPHKGKGVRFYLDKGTGAMVKSIVLDEDGNPQLTTVVKDIQVNPALSEDRFTYTPPAGVELTDADAIKQTGTTPHGAAPMTTTPNAPAAPAAPTAPAPAAPFPAPAK